jgi:hypothetical protein
MYGSLILARQTFGWFWRQAVRLVEDEADPTLLCLTKVLRGHQ